MTKAQLKKEMLEVYASLSETMAQDLHWFKNWLDGASYGELVTRAKTLGIKVSK